MPSSTSILVHKNKILLILRDNKPNIPEPNTWQLPGGGVEEGEDHFQAIQRELQEEISIIPSQLKYLGTAPGDTKVFFAFLDDSEIPNIKLGNEGQKLEFFSLEEVFSVPLTKKLKFYFSTYKAGILELIENGNIKDLKSLGLTV